MKYRAITTRDIPSIFEVRVATDENKFTYEELERFDITPESVEQKLKATYRGWLCETDGDVVGFVIANKQTGEIWVIAVLPEYINKGIGTQLLNLAEHWLISSGKNNFWLTTDTDKSLRAYSFYLKNGWKEWKEENGLLYMKKKAVAFA